MHAPKVHIGVLMQMIFIQVLFFTEQDLMVIEVEIFITVVIYMAVLMEVLMAVLIAVLMEGVMVMADTALGSERMR